MCSDFLLPWNTYLWRLVCDFANAVVTLILNWLCRELGFLDVVLPADGSVVNHSNSILFVHTVADATSVTDKKPFGTVTWYPTEYFSWWNPGNDDHDDIESWGRSEWELALGSTYAHIHWFLTRETVCHTSHTQLQHCLSAADTVSPHLNWNLACLLYTEQAMRQHLLVITVYQ